MVKETATEIFVDPVNDGLNSFFAPPRIEAEPGWLKHVYCDGVRYHVLSWAGGNGHSVTFCSEPRCIINKPETTPDIVGRQSHEGALR